MRIKIYETDVLVVGGGMAAMRAAIAAADDGVDVVVVSKAPAAKSGASVMAGGGIAAVMPLQNPLDSVNAHFEDTVRVGRGLTDPDLARIMAEEAPKRIQDLIDYGVHFRLKDGELELLPTPGHSQLRSLHSVHHGAGFVNPMRRKMLSYPNVHLHDDVMALRLFIDADKAAGALCLDIKSGELAAFVAGATIMATGGYQDIYPTSSASCDVTGDGYVMAFEAGAELVDMEILLYYPTAILSPASLRGVLLLYELVLRKQGGLGACLLNVDGDDLLEGYDQLPVRDELSRLIFNEVARGKGTEYGGVYIDIGRSSVPMPDRMKLLKKVYTYELLTSLGFDVAEGRFEVGPAAHTVLGGIRINARCESSVPGLFAAGEAAGNIHGANRIGGNALADTQVFGFRAGHFAAKFASERGRPCISDQAVVDAAKPVLRMTEAKSEPKDVLEIKNAIRQTMFRHVGPTRSEEGITSALRRIENILEIDIPRMAVDSKSSAYNYSLVEALEGDFMARVAALVCHGALARRESRGHHYRSDFPAADDSRTPQRTRIYQKDGELRVELYPVS